MLSYCLVVIFSLSPHFRRQVAKRATIAHKQVSLNSSQVNIRFFFQLVKGSRLCSPWLDQILTLVKGCNSVANLPKK